MSRRITASSGWVKVFLAAMASWLACAGASGAVTVLGVQYQQDELFPEYNCIWHDKDYPTACAGTYLGGNVHVYLKNTGASAVTVDDVTLAGYSLAAVIELNTSYHSAQSIYFHWDNPPQDILDAGGPVWYKADPAIIPGTIKSNIHKRTNTAMSKYVARAFPYFLKP